MEKELKKRTDYYAEDEIKVLKLGTDPNYKHEYITWLVIRYATLQFFAIFGVYALFFKIKLATFIWAWIMGFLSGQGVILGSHRGYAHKSFKATKTLQLILIFLQTMSGQNDVFWWARDHRVHHKFSDTDADPYNASRGFFFAHMRWLMLKKHPLVLEKGKSVDVSDLREDKIVMFQKKYILPMHFVIAFMIPTLIPVYGWNENFWASLFVNYFLRINIVLNITGTINSVAHHWGMKPVDKRIKPTQSAFTDWVTFGDGWHNYHHIFPWDCGTSEFGYKKGLSTRLLEFFAYCGLAYDLKTTSQSVMLGHARRHGDGTLPILDKKSTAACS